MYFFNFLCCVLKFCNFLRVHFFVTFSTDSKSTSNSRFWYIYWHWQNLEKIFLGSYKHFLQTFKPNAHETAQKNEKCILQMCLRIHFFIHLWFRTVNFLKKSLNRCSLMYTFKKTCSAKIYSILHCDHKF